MATVINASDANFSEEVLDASLPVLVDFWAPWCGYCMRLAPVIDELADELGEKMKMVKVNVDENRGLAQKYGVMSLPTMIIFKNGQEVDKLMGFMPKAALAAKLQPVL